MGHVGVTAVRVKTGPAAAAGLAEALEAALAEALLRRYGGRDRRVVYVHELLEPAYMLPSLRLRPRTVNGYMVVGEAVERGLRDMLGAREAPQRCAAVSAAAAAPETAEALRAAGVEAEQRGGRLGFRLCGSTDIEAVVGGETVYIEVKTTRGRFDPGGRHRRWAVQAGLYSALYGAPVLLLVVELNSGGEQLRWHLVEAPEGYLDTVVSMWASGSLFIPAQYPLPRVARLG